MWVMGHQWWPSIFSLLPRHDYCSAVAFSEIGRTQLVATTDLLLLRSNLWMPIGSIHFAYPSAPAKAAILQTVVVHRLPFITKT